MLEELAYFLLAKSQMAVEKWAGREQDLKHVRASYYVESCTRPVLASGVEALSTYKIRATDTLKSLRRTACLHAR